MVNLAGGSGRTSQKKRQFMKLVAPLKHEPPVPSKPAMGFFTDTSICIGCKACEVACRQWNQLSAPETQWSGHSYDNTGQLSATTWRHVQFIEQVRVSKPQIPAQPELPLFTTNDQLTTNDQPVARVEPAIPAVPSGTALPFFSSDRWLMQSDVCKHCANAPCQEACPTGAIIRTEFDTVYVQQDICNGCGYCIVACPFGVIARDEKGDHLAHKCTLCYDRLKEDMQPACAKACPTQSIVFGEVEHLKQQARERVGSLQQRGVHTAQLYGVDDTILQGGLHSFFLLLDQPEVYNLPQDPPRPSNNVWPTSFWTIVSALLMGVLGMLFFKQD
ncbi:4Fe-4S dicluster domain-containing protein [Tengunoibacter tsumagoiensis]|uniref:Ferredoxin n=1 Tax=Tengunoibacter tsumagoiensis TaxID=2014871 RepID=A0A402A263_9CHLR|nr:4Fe-4S dicluster domain-containing protein [Tengunoibacter tsumagoiensis]GCE13214.1 ferredoxin [Tengunoibacter tsumagoiensis]